MSKAVPILLGTGAVAVLVFGVVHLAKTSNTAGKIDINLENFGIKSQGLKGADLGKLKIPDTVVFKADVKVNNPTDADLVISKPYLKVFYNGKQIANSTASAETINLKAKDVSYIKDLEVEFHALDVLPIMPDFLKYVISRFAGNPSTRKVKIDMLVDANGITSTQTKEVSI